MTQRLSRRSFACGLAALAVCIGFPSVTHAQQPPKRIGVVLVGHSPQDKVVQEFRKGLSDAGHKEGEDVIIEWRSSAGNYERVPALIAGLIERKVDVIVIQTTFGVLAAKRATSTIPIVMASVGDPVGSGLVASLAHPGGNVTGTSLMMTDLSAKRLQLLKETIPGITRVAVMLNPVNPWYKGVVEEVRVAARSLSITLRFIDVQREEEIGPAFLAIRQARAQALFLIEDALLAAQRTKLLKLASKAKLPVSSGTRDYVADGGLMSYSASFSWMFRRSAYYVDRILKGTKPADLPVEQPTRFEFVVNLKTAKALGITLPESILIRADEVIK